MSKEPVCATTIADGWVSVNQEKAHPVVHGGLVRCGVDTAFWSIQDQCLDVVGPSLSGWDLFDVGRVVGGTVVC